MRLPILRYQPPPLYFMHIPKTAGSALRQLFAAAYPTEAILGYYPQYTSQFAAADLARFRCISSHWGPGLLPFLLQQGLACLTIVRDPVEQFVSHCYFRQSQLNRYPKIFQPAYWTNMQPLLKSDLRTLIESLESPRPMLIDNIQTRCLGYVEEMRPYFRDGALGQKGRILLEQPYQYSTTLDIQQIATNAHQQLEKMAVVGITERFAESIELICDLLGIPAPAEALVANVGVQKNGVVVHSYRQQLPADLLDLILAKTKFDQELYAHACERFEAQLARHRATPQRTISLAPWLLPFTQGSKQGLKKVNRRLRMIAGNIKKIIKANRPIS